MSADRKSLLKDDSGAAMLEFTAAAFTFFIMLFGIIEFSNVFYQWNAATKAVQLGARLAAVSNPVAEELLTLTGMEGGALPGETMPAYDYTCSSSSNTCSGDGGTRNLNSLRTIVFGRCGDPGETCTNGVRLACNGASKPRNIGMCNIFPKITIDKVVVRYEYTGLGYAGRPGGAVPTVTVSLKDIPYDFIMIGSFLPVRSITMPGFATTVTGEDLRQAWAG